MEEPCPVFFGRTDDLLWLCVMQPERSTETGRVRKSEEGTARSERPARSGSSQQERLDKIRKLQTHITPFIQNFKVLKVVPLVFS